jgi:hypothetical protein
MATTLTHTQVRSVSGVNYLVVDTVTAATNGLTIQVFVMSGDTNTFERVADPGDLSLPTTSTVPYWRTYTVTGTFATLSDAQDFSQLLETRLQQLVTNYDAALSGFVGTTTETLSS